VVAVLPRIENAKGSPNAKGYLHGFIERIGVSGGAVPAILGRPDPWQGNAFTRLGIRTARVPGGAREQIITFLEPLYFAPDSDALLDQSKDVILQVGEVLKSSPELERVGIETTGGNRGWLPEKRELAERRAKSVLRALTVAGIKPERLETVAGCPSHLSPTNPSAGAKARNGRLVFRLLEVPRQRGQ
jgi:outer membrane protein OmpA-like peptidoglycan-associated protein